MLPGETMIAYCYAEDDARNFVDHGGGGAREYLGARFTVADLYSTPNEAGRAVVDLRDEWHRRNT